MNARWNGGAAALLLSAVTLALLALPASSASLKAADAWAPWTVSSAGGVLDVLLEDEAVAVDILGESVLARVWNRSFVAPVLRVLPGDRVTIRLANYLDVSTNLHFHGLDIPPVAPADDAFTQVGTGQTYVYQFAIPLDHPRGMFWYHSHAMNAVVDSQWQVYNGMSGALIVDGILDAFPALLANDTERVLCLRDVNVTDGGLPGVGEIDVAGGSDRLVNGARLPVFPAMAANETQFWRIANVGADLFYALTFEPAVPLHIIARDGRLQTGYVVTETVVLGPGARVEFFVQAPADGGPQLVLMTDEFFVGNLVDDDVFPSTPLVTVPVGPAAVARIDLAAAAAGSFPELTDYRLSAIAVNRTIVFQTVPGTETEPEIFVINGKVFDMDRVDTVVTLGTVERWILGNNSTEQHVRSGKGAGKRRWERRGKKARTRRRRTHGKGAHT